MEMYQTIPFILEDGSENKKTCPVINTEIFLKHGLEQKDKQQILEGNIMILPSICMCPIDFETGYRRKSKKNNFGSLVSCKLDGKSRKRVS